MGKVVDAKLDNLLSYNRYNLIDHYARWEQNLQTSFVFWDTIGDNRFIKNMTRQMGKSDIIIMMYDLSDCAARFYNENNNNNNNDHDDNYTWLEKAPSVKFMQQFDRKLNKMVGYDVRNDDSGNKVGYKFETMVIGAMKDQFLDSNWTKKEVETVHDRVIKYFSKNLECFNVRHENNEVENIGYHQIIFNINHHAVYGGKIRSSSVLETMLKIEKLYMATSRKHDGDTSIFAPKCECCSRDNSDNKHKKRKNEIKFNSGSGDEATLLLRKDLDLVLGSATNPRDPANAALVAQHLVKGPISVRYKSFTRKHCVMFQRFLRCFLSGAFFPFILGMNTYLLFGRPVHLAIFCWETSHKCCSCFFFVV